MEDSIAKINKYCAEYNHKIDEADEGEYLEVQIIRLLDGCWAVRDNLNLVYSTEDSDLMVCLKEATERLNYRKW